MLLTKMHTAKCDTGINPNGKVFNLEAAFTVAYMQT
jgi:hypothetical protein